MWIISHINTTFWLAPPYNLQWLWGALYNMMQTPHCRRIGLAKEAKEACVSAGSLSLRNTPTAITVISEKERAWLSLWVIQITGNDGILVQILNCCANFWIMHAWLFPFQLDCDHNPTLCINLNVSLSFMVFCPIFHLLVRRALSCLRPEPRIIVTVEKPAWSCVEESIMADKISWCVWLYPCMQWLCNVIMQGCTSACAATWHACFVFFVSSFLMFSVDLE